MFKDIFKDDLYIKHTWYILDRYLYICLQEFYPDKKPLEAKAKKDYGKREIWLLGWLKVYNVDGNDHDDHDKHHDNDADDHCHQQGTRHTRLGKTLTHFTSTLRYFKHGNKYLSKVLFSNLLFTNSTSITNCLSFCKGSMQNLWTFFTQKKQVAWHLLLPEP